MLRRALLLARPGRGLSGQAGMVSGAPADVYAARGKVLIYSPARSASQQGKAFDGVWKISFGDGEQRRVPPPHTPTPACLLQLSRRPRPARRWENPLMGWTSTADTLGVVARSALEFGSADAAADFAARQGWAYEVVQPQVQSLGTSCIKGAGKGKAPGTQARAKRARACGSAVSPLTGRVAARAQEVKQYAQNFSVKRRGIPVWTPGQSNGE